MKLSDISTLDLIHALRERAAKLTAAVPTDPRRDPQWSAVREAIKREITGDVDRPAASWQMPHDDACAEAMLNGLADVAVDALAAQTDNTVTAAIVLNALSDAVLAAAKKQTMREPSWRRL